MSASLVGSEMCIRDRPCGARVVCHMALHLSLDEMTRRRVIAHDRHAPCCPAGRSPSLGVLKCR
eukprot:2693326-Alexandrium_andersonii.AAC.1